MEPDGLVGFLITQGALGLGCIGLFWLYKTERAERNADRLAHKIEIAAKDATILALQESRLAETKQTVALTTSVQSTLDTFLATVTGK